MFGGGGGGGDFKVARSTHFESFLRKSGPGFGIFVLKQGLEVFANSHKTEDFSP